jgi:hypothetical protein
LSTAKKPSICVIDCVELKTKGDGFERLDFAVTKNSTILAPQNFKRTTS